MFVYVGLRPSPWSLGTCGWCAPRVPTDKSCAFLRVVVKEFLMRKGQVINALFLETQRALGWSNLGQCGSGRPAAPALPPVGGAAVTTGWSPSGPPFHSADGCDEVISGPLSRVSTQEVSENLGLDFVTRVCEAPGCACNCVCVRFSWGGCCLSFPSHSQMGPQNLFI